jgi:hypothetical protein
MFENVNLKLYLLIFHISSVLIIFSFIIIHYIVIVNNRVFLYIRILSNYQNFRLSESRLSLINSDYGPSTFYRSLLVYRDGLFTW